MQTSSFMYNVDRDLLPQQLRTIFIPSSQIHDHNTKGKDNIHIHSYQTKVKAHSICLYDAKVWNAIHISITTSNLNQSHSLNPVLGSRCKFQWSFLEVPFVP